MKITECFHDELCRLAAAI
ncbi:MULTISPECIES: protein YrbN [Erwinia]|nr:protein YrbN [Erwinia endophytica]QEW34287.1 protein YrbN [Erwinia billingiae]